VNFAMPRNVIIGSTIFPLYKFTLSSYICTYT
jgi:hypothetical protein